MTASTAVFTSLPPPPASSETHLVDRSPWYTDLKLLAPVGAAVGLALWQPSDDGVTICPWRNCTGGACPGCGLTRSAASFFKADFATSWYYHPAAVLIIVQAAAIWALAVGRRAGIITWRAPTSLVKLFVVVNGVALIGLWLLRWRLGHLERVL